MLQETHSTEFEKQKWNEDWNSEMLFNHGTSNSKGTLIDFLKIQITKLSNMTMTRMAEFKSVLSLLMAKKN